MKKVWQLGLVTILTTFLFACAPTISQDGSSTVQTPTNSERLGTQWGDEVNSHIQEVNLVRASHSPIDEMTLYYSAKNYNGRSLNNITLAAGKIEFSVESDRNKLPLVRDGSQYYLQGKDGEAYQLIYRNRSAETYEIVASVDGLDVLTGQAASRNHTGYVLRPHDTLIIEGFRKSQDSVASFIFSAPRNAYAAHTDAGSVRNMGIIGTAIYELYDPRAMNNNINRPQAFPADNGYAKPPR